LAAPVPPSHLVSNMLASTLPALLQADAHLQSAAAATIAVLRGVDDAGTIAIRLHRMQSESHDTVQSVIGLCRQHEAAAACAAVLGLSTFSRSSTSEIANH
jgi:hypothetical protein